MEKEIKKKKAKATLPKVKSFAKPYSHRQNVMGIDAYDDNLFISDSDPNGSYTGITRDGDNRPVQDVDDL